MQDPRTPWPIPADPRDAGNGFDGSGAGAIRWAAGAIAVAAVSAAALAWWLA